MLPQGLYWLFLAFSLIPLLANDLVLGLPWDPVNGRASMGSLISGATPVEGIGPLRINQVPHKRHLGVKESEASGNLTILTHQTSPPLFLINRKQLYYYLNETTIFPVNILNTTLPERPPLQLVVGKKFEGLKGGSWRFSGSMLYHDFPDGAQGLFWTCPLESGWPGIFMFAHKEDGHVTDCNSLTFHSFDHS